MNTHSFRLKEETVHAPTLKDIRCIIRGLQNKSELLNREFFHASFEIAHITHIGYWASMLAGLGLPEWDNCTEQGIGNEWWGTIGFKLPMLNSTEILNQGEKFLFIIHMMNQALVFVLAKVRARSYLWYQLRFLTAIPFWPFLFS